jgi:hypothetical protein
MGAGSEAADLGVWRGSCVARILEPETLNSLELFSAAKILSGPGAGREAGRAVARTLQSTAWGLSRQEILAIINSLLHGTTVW